jgi:hypothetical protein
MGKTDDIRIQQLPSAEDTAKDIINLISKQIQDKFGLTVTMVAELEFSVVPTEEARNRPDFDPQKLIDSIESSDKNLASDCTPSSLSPPIRHNKNRQTIEAVKAPYFEQSPIISYVHVEDDTSAQDSQKYEIIFSHHTSAGEHAPARLARAITSVQNLIKAAQPVKITKTRGDRGLAFTSPLPKNPDIKYVSVDSFPYLWNKNIPDYEITHGLHIGISLEDSSGNNLLEIMLEQHKFLNILQSCFLNVSRDTCALIIDEEENFKRLKYHNQFAPHDFNSSLEVRTPTASK